MTKVLIGLLLLLGAARGEKEIPKKHESSPAPPSSTQGRRMGWTGEYRRPGLDAATGETAQYEGDYPVRLEVPFTVLEGGYLAIDVDPWIVEIERFGKKLKVPVGMIPPNERLYLFVPRQKIKVDRLEQLQNRIRIESCAEALAFVRLLTSPRTFRLWPGERQRRSEVEILSNEDLDSTLVFGLRPPWPVGERTAGRDGILCSGGQMRELGIASAQARAIEGGFEVRRALMVVVHHDATSSAHMEQVVEGVGYDGSYERREAHTTGLPEDGVWWRFTPRM